MSTWTPWNEVKWAKANAEIGLKRDEICPGLTVDQHAESLAMFDCHDVGTSNKVHSAIVGIIKEKIKKALYGGSDDIALWNVSNGG